MREISKTQNALISVYDKSGIEDFARGLSDLGWKIYASGGTAEAIKKAGTDVSDVSELVGGKAILGHRVVTLSREIHAGILADDSPEQKAELAQLGIPRIDLVCVDMYPLETAIKDKASEAEVIEKTDVGGPTLLHAAAKGRRIVLSRPEQRREVLEWLKADRPNQPEFIKKLAATAELEVANYIFESAKYLNGPESFGFIGSQIATAKYGENPWQTQAGLYANSGGDSLSLAKFEQISGTELSYNNLADIDRLLQTITHICAGFDKNYTEVPAIALGAKHGNVCGVAVAQKPAEAIKRMLDGDPRAIFGGVVMVNFVVEEELANLLISHGIDGGKRLLDVVAAPQFSNEAVEILQRKGGKLRLVANPSLSKLNQQSIDTTRRFRYVRGGALAQQNYDFILDLDSGELEKTGNASAQLEKDMLLAWAIGCTSNSNTLTLVKNGMLIGNGVGQQDRVSAAELALKRAKDAAHDIKGAVAYSDSFFPFPDGPETLAKAGISAIFATRGSVNDDKVVESLKNAGVIFYSLPDSAARGFYAH